MAWFVSQSLLVILAAFLLGMVVGWLVWGKRRSPLPQAGEASVVRPADAEGFKVAVTSTAHAEPRPANPATMVRGERVAGGQDTLTAAKDAATRTTESPSTTTPATTTVEPAAPAVASVATTVEPATATVVSTATTAEPATATGVSPATTAKPAITTAEASKVEPATTTAETAKVESAATAEPVATTVESATPAVGSADTPGDELERIEGIGPKMATALRAAGIHTFRQLADADDDTRRAAIEAAGLTFAPSLVTWGRQARLLANGDEAGFAKLTELLTAGRDTGRS
ncbi:hypothetical protein Pen02_52980 [Plantactinospora endophytica]|uniref:Helix-hairpin-helix DNA-binding motif class 1 domain-containing protein n=1 Tax=Plantactinospora endophytica TaxID=673535 RepID=A0ABQ4E7U8_9ACTN|nr:hypothetical protein Pen02_52980 [Plantactinospora endophytica]